MPRGSYDNFKSRKQKPEPGSHQEDITETAKILLEARDVGFARISNTVVGDITVWFHVKARNYTIEQTVDGRVVSNTSVMRRQAQEYLISLRERRREQDVKQKTAS
jgi:hypothetical protein